GTGLDAVIIDFAQNIRGADDIYTRMSDVAISAQDMARRLKVGVVLFSQLSNDMAKELADLDSGKDPNFVSF
ncbi:MAG: hypothetical protein GTN76_08660, partial [Candidatus Aenigmarchaeota archaeon]|nr:hypothetical protein [Candidatus Aenigmarchaeota archaeon]